MAYDLEAMLMRQTGWKDDLKAGFVMMREMRVMLNYLISRETTTTTCPRSSACDWCFCPLIMTVTMRGKASVVRGRVSFYFFLFFFIFLYFSLFFFIFLYFSLFFFIFLYFSLFFFIFLLLLLLLLLFPLLSLLSNYMLHVLPVLTKRIRLPVVTRCHVAFRSSQSMLCHVTRSLSCNKTYLEWAVFLILYHVFIDWLTIEERHVHLRRWSLSFTGTSSKAQATPWHSWLDHLAPSAHPS
jgi:hypothetical protein